MIRLITFLLFTALISCDDTATSDTPISDQDMTSTYPTIGAIEVYDSSLYELIDQDAEIEILAEGFTWSERRKFDAVWSS